MPEPRHEEPAAAQGRDDSATPSPGASSSGTGHDAAHGDRCGCFDCVPSGTGYPKRPADRVTDAAPAQEYVYAVFSYGDPMPITSCRTPELAEQYADALGRLPQRHPLYTANACVDKLPLLSELPEPLRDPEKQEWQDEGRPRTYGA